MDTAQPARGAGSAEEAAAQAARALGRGDVEAAIPALRQATAGGTRDPHAYNNLGVISARAGELDAAISLFEQALARDPGLTDARANLAEARALRGVGHYREQRLRAALEDLRVALELQPRNARTASDLGVVLAALGQAADAVTCYRHAIAVDPAHQRAYVNLGASLLAAGQAEEAARVLEVAVALAPQDSQALINLSGVEEKRGNLTLAEALARQALALAPGSESAHHNVALALLQQGDLPGTLEHFRAAVALAPGRADLHSALLFASNNDPASSPEALAEQHRAFDVRFGGGAAPRGARAVSGRRLRVGYLSPDLRGHSVASFFEPLLAAHDRSAVEVTCYSDSGIVDQVTQRLRATAEHWRTTGSLPGDALAELIRRDDLDVLVELAGHTGSNRMAVLAQRIAPVQLTYLGYPSTTGLGAMDHRITDAVADPVGRTEHLHTEALVRVDGGFLCYSAPVAPPVVPPPSLADGAVTFGSFNSLIKVNDGVLDAWARLLAAVPRSRLLLKARAFSEEKVRERLWKALEARNIERARVELVRPAAGTAEHLATYGRLDIALDTFPYNGTTTTCEALWMGVPVVTFAGTSHLTRVGASLLSRVGLEDLAAPALEESLVVAARLAADVDRRARLRQELRERMLASPLMDAKRLARQLEAAYLRAASGS